MKFFTLASITFFISLITAAFCLGQNFTAVNPSLFPTNMSGQIHGISRVSEMRYHPTDSMKLYAVSARGGLYISTNQGNSWSVAPGCDAMAPSKRFSSVCVDFTNDQIIYLGIGDENYYSSGQGIYKSTDGGTTFTATTLTSKLVTDIIMDPKNHNTLVAATNVGVYKTTNGGATWTLKSSSSISSRELVMKPDSNSRVLYLATASDFYRSTDFGETWNLITSGISTTGGGCRLGVTPIDTNVVYFVTNAGYGTIYKSTDGGTNFTLQKTGDAVSNLVGYSNTVGDAGQGNYNTAFCVDRTNANIVYFVAHNVWKSVDGGVTWTQLTNWWAKVHTDMHQIFTSPYNTTKLWDINDGGVWLSTDGGNNWTPKSDGIYGYEIYHGSCSPTRKDMISIGTQDNGELYGTAAGWFTNRGGDWGSDCLFDKRSSSNMVYYFGNGNRRYVSGSQSVFANSTLTTGIAFTNTNLNRAFFCDTFVYRTGNLLTGAPPTWTTILATKKTFKDIYYPPADSTVLYVITNGGQLYKSTNALAATPTFTAIALPFSSNNAAHITGISNDADKIYVILNTRVYYSADGGSSWTNVTYNLPSTNNISIITDYYYPNQHIVYAITPNAVYYKKGAATTSWTNISSGLPGYPTLVNASAYDDGTANSMLRVFTYGRGVWEAPMTPYRDFDAQFTSTDSLSCATGKIVYFKDVSNGSPVSRVWSFPGGTPSSSTAASPTVIYSTPGNYTVTLIAYNGFSYDTLTIPNYVSFINECGLDTVPDKAMSFSGTGSYVTVPTLPMNTNTITITAWVKLLGQQPAYSGIFMTDGTANGFNFKVSGNSNYLGCHWNGTGIWSNTGADSIPRNKWTHVAFVVSPTNAKLYVNGKATTITTTMAAVNFMSLTAKIGSYQAWSSRNMNNALIDEVCIYNRSLSQNEIRELMHLTKTPAVESSLVLYYQFNELSTTNTVYDKTANYLHGQVFNCNRLTSTGPFGGGSFSRLTVAAAGTYNFTGTDVSMTFPSAASYPNGDLVVSRINLSPDQLPQSTYLNARSYWIVNNYGTNNSFTALSAISFSKIGTVPISTVGGNMNLYKPSSYLDGATWPNSICTGTSVTTGTDGAVSFTSPGITSFSMFDVVNQGILLPIEWLSFGAHPSAKIWGVDLNWVMTKIDHAVRYEIERSSDALHFDSIGSVDASMTFNSLNLAYYFFDANPNSGINYYRIKQMDQLGNATYSAVRKVNFKYSSENHVHVFPNPVGETQAFYFSNDWGLSMNIALYDASGRFMMNRIIPNKSSFPAILTKGIYFYWIKMDGNLVSGKFIVE